jgi:hypothetical protein
VSETGALQALLKHGSGFARHKQVLLSTSNGLFYSLTSRVVFLQSNDLSALYLHSVSLSVEY